MDSYAYTDRYNRDLKLPSPRIPRRAPSGSRAQFLSSASSTSTTNSTLWSSFSTLDRRRPSSHTLSVIACRALSRCRYVLRMHDTWWSIDVPLACQARHITDPWSFWGWWEDPEEGEIVNAGRGVHGRTIAVHPGFGMISLIYPFYLTSCSHMPRSPSFARWMSLPRIHHNPLMFFFVYRHPTRVLLRHSPYSHLAITKE